MNPVVYAIGDSVMQGAGPELHATLPAACPGIGVDAVPSRQFRAAPTLVRRRLKGERPPDIVVVHLGTNGLFSAAEFDDLVDAAGDAAVLFLTIKAPRDWEATVNERLARGVERHQLRTSLLDWNAIASATPASLCQDGFHLTRTGAGAYADAITGAVAEQHPERRARPLTE